MSYKQFIQELEDDVSPVEAQSRCAVLDPRLLVHISGRHILQLEPDFVPFHQKNNFCYVCYTFCIAVCDTVSAFLCVVQFLYCLVWYTFCMVDVTCENSLTF